MLGLNLLGLVFLLLLIIVGYIFAIRKIQKKRSGAVREQPEEDGSK